MSSAAIVQNLNLLDGDYRRVSPTLVETFLAGNDDAKAFVAAEIEVRRIRKEIIDRPVIVGADEFKPGRRLNAESATDNPFALNDAFRRRLRLL